jgi:hypothetical protein
LIFLNRKVEEDLEWEGGSRINKVNRINRKGSIEEKERDI